MLVILVTYFKPFNIGFGLRDNIFMHSAAPSIPFAIMQILVD